MSRLDPSHLDAATLVTHLDGTPRQRRALAELVLDLVERAVYHALRSRAGSLSRKDDLVSDVLLYLHRNEARVLRQWNPELASLKGYLDMVSRRHVWRRVATEPSMVSLEEVGAEAPIVVPADLEDELSHRAALAQLDAFVHEHCTPKDVSRFRALFVQGKPPIEVASLEGATPEAIYTWASRFKQRLAAAFPQVVELIESRLRARRPKQ